MKLLRLTAMLFLAVVALSPAVEAQGNLLDGPRASGVVGERFDGLAVVRDSNAAADVRTLVDQVNAQRRQVYARRANEQGVAADQVGRVYAAQIFGAAPAGTWFLQENGQWTRK